MIPAIGFMVGAYIITRMVSLIADKKETGIVTTIFAGITILVTIYCIYLLLTSGTDLSNIQWLP